MLWNIDQAHSQIQFSTKHMGISTVRGTFGSFDGTIDTEDGQVSGVTAEIDVASLDTGNGQRDGHLKSPDYFDIANHPRITFTAKGAKDVDHDGSWELTGDLTINGITKPITLSVEWGGVMKDPWGNTKAGVTINGKLNRKDWNLNWNAALEAGGMLVSDEVRISCEVQLAKQG